MKTKKEKQKNHKLRSKVYKISGTTTTLATTTGGFFAYEIATDWSNFKTELENFVVIQQDTVKLNLLLAMPILISLLVFIWVYRKKNKKALEGKVALPLLFGIIILWLVYSMIEVTLLSLIGAFVGSLFDEMLFNPLSVSSLKKYEDDHEVELEVRKEKMRRKVREEINGTV